MNGSNHREEADRKPLQFCSECHGKIWWTCRVDPHTRYQELITFSDEAGLAEQGAFWPKLDRAVSETKSRK